MCDSVIFPVYMYVLDSSNTCSNFDLAGSTLSRQLVEDILHWDCVCVCQHSHMHIIHCPNYRHSTLA